MGKILGVNSLGKSFLVLRASCLVGDIYQQNRAFLSVMVSLTGGVDGGRRVGVVFAVFGQDLVLAVRLTGRVRLRRFLGGDFRA